MSDDPEQQTSGQAGGAGAPSEEELRAAYEAELSRITPTDMMAQAAVSLLNIAARNLAPGGGPDTGGAAASEATAPSPAGEQQAAPPPVDLEQVRDAIDGVRALLEILERRIPTEVRPLRDALSQLQMAYAAEVRAAGQGASASGSEEGQSPPAAGEDSAAEAAGPQGPGPAEASGRLWVPGR
ncbi:MAG TPA: hypothetical protein VKG62_07805 [Solirubrobacteraceae bacterium]|nr:hypothetical protein [Solirubrobacteraceae bacterium]